jgi:hypothetical protein
MVRARLVLCMLAGLSIAACATPIPSPPSTSQPSAVVPPSAAPTASAAPAGVDLTAVPTACVGLAPQDCSRVLAETASVVPAGTVVRYVQVGPFGCAASGACPASLAARPQGDVTLEAADVALSYHVTWTDPASGLAIDRQDAFGVLLAPTSTPPVALGPQPFTLGHCGLWSGIDVGGSWWDPVGQVDGDHPDAINAADATLALVDADHAILASEGGLTVQLLRRDGMKYLPGCD